MKQILLLLVCMSFTLGAISQETIIEEEVLRTFAPDFSFEMEDGSKKNLSDYKGQVLYISFWASWCKPCIVNFEKYRDIRNQMEELGITMLNISVDKDDVKWREAMTSLNINGDHAKVAKSSIQELYQLYSVPRYEIVGKNGEFLYLSDDPNRNILDNFRSFLEK